MLDVGSAVNYLYFFSVKGFNTISLSPIALQKKIEIALDVSVKRSVDIH